MHSGTLGTGSLAEGTSQIEAKRPARTSEYIDRKQTQQRSGSDLRSLQVSNQTRRRRSCWILAAISDSHPHPSQAV